LITKLRRAACACLPAMGILAGSSSPVWAQPFEPVVELFRLTQEDRLIIDRGGPVDLAGDLNGDGLDDIILGSGVGGVRVVFGPTNGNAGTVNVANLDGNSGFVIVHDNENISVLAGIGDINGDGLDDVAVGSAAWTIVVFGRNPGFPRDITPGSIDGGNGFIFNSPATAVSAAGDVNGDGVDDLLIGNANASPGNSTGAGISYIIHGSTTRFARELSPASLNGDNGFAVLGGFEQDRSGYSVGAAGDFNNDGIGDFLIGAPNKTQAGSAEAGEAYLIYGIDGGFPAAISLSNINGGNGLIFRGAGIQDYVGAAVSGVGDINHDGVDDIAIGSPSKGPFGSPNDYPGEAYVLFGGRFDNVAEVTEQGLNGSNGFTIRGIRGGVVPIRAGEAIWGDMVGQSVDRIGDFNDDGIDDMIVGASHAILSPSRKGSGQAYIIFGNRTGFPVRLQLSELDGVNGFRIDGIGTVDYFGFSVSGAGDFNADTFGDVIIGASGEGASYIIYGRNNGAGRPVPASAPLNPSAASTGFEAVGFERAPDARALAFNELRDPTGPNPYPEGTSTTLGDPSTPGNIAPILDPMPTPTVEPSAIVPVEPLQPPGPMQPNSPTEPNAPAEPGAPGAPDVPAEPADPAGPNEQPEVIPPDFDGSTPPSSSAQQPALEVGRSGGSVHGFMLLVLGLMVWMRGRSHRLVKACHP